MTDHWRRAQLQQVADRWDEQAARAEDSGAEYAGFWRRVADRAADRAAELAAAYRDLSDEVGE